VLFLPLLLPWLSSVGKSDSVELSKEKTMEPFKSQTEVDQRVAYLQAACSSASELFYKDHKNRQTAVAMFELALAQLRLILGAMSIEVATSLDKLGGMLMGWGKRSHSRQKRHERLLAAQAAYRERLQILEHNAQDAISLAFAYHGASYAWVYDANYVEACALKQKAIDIATTISHGNLSSLPVDNPLREQLPHIIGHQGGFYLRAGEYLKAVEVLQQALASLELNTGSKVHKDSYYLYQWLSQASRKLGDQIEKTRPDYKPGPQRTRAKA